MARNLARSSSGTVGSSARARTRALKSIQDSSRLKNRSGRVARRSEEHTSELQSLMCISYAVFCLKKKITNKISTTGSTPTHKSQQYSIRLHSQYNNTTN